MKFLIDANGILQVGAKDMRTGEQHSIEVQPSYGINDDEIERMLEESIEYAEQDFAERQAHRSAHRIRSDPRRYRESTCNNPQCSQTYPPRARRHRTSAVAALKEAAAGTDYKQIRKRIDDLNHATEHLAELLMNSRLHGARRARSWPRFKDDITKSPTSSRHETRGGAASFAPFNGCGLPSRGATIAVTFCRLRCSQWRHNKMGGSNPYIEEVKYKPATQKYKVTFLPSGKTVEVDPEKFPYGHNGLPGSILDISEGFKDGPRSRLRRRLRLLHLPRHREAGPRILQRSHRRRTRRARRGSRHHAKSRLGCQTVPDGTTDIVVEIPEWNKNYAKEADH